MNSPKIRQHKLVEKAPVPVAILMSILWLMLYQVLEYAINLPVSGLISGYDATTGPIGLIVSIAILMGVYKWWFRPEFEGMLKGRLPLGFLLGLAELAYLLLSFVINILSGYELNIKPMTAGILFISLAAGIGEEFVFRGVLISTLMRQWKDQNKFRTAAMISGVFFGLSHAANVLAGADPVRTLLQVIGSISVGVIFAAVYMRSGSLLPCMFYHTVHDIIAIAGESEVTENGIITGSNLRWTDGVDLVLSIALVVIALWMLRAAQNGEMQEIWNRKWKPAAETAQQKEDAASD